MKLDVSIIVPGYNEEKRMRPFLEKLISFCKKNIKNYELIFVDDGSKDDTAKIYHSYAKKDSHIRVISYKPNHGKGHAVAQGVFASNGSKIIFIDIDGSIQPDEIPEMIRKLDQYEVVVGSRASVKSQVKQPPLRKMTSSLFNPYVNLLFQNQVGDHLCGFKGFRRQIAVSLFKKIIDKRWLFDVELFYHIRRNKYSLYEQPIHWVHREESKMSIIEPFKMAIKLIILRIKLIKKIR